MTNEEFTKKVKEFLTNRNEIIKLEKSLKILKEKQHERDVEMDKICRAPGRMPIFWKLESEMSGK